MTSLSPEISLAVTAVVTLVLDQVTKLVALRSAPVTIGSSVCLRAIHNRRGGMIGLSNMAAAAVSLTAVGAIAFLAMTVAPLTVGRGLGLGLMFGGAGGNLVDRFCRSGVIDFVRIRRWRVFNVADLALCTGLAITAGTLL